MTPFQHEETQIPLFTLDELSRTLKNMLEETFHTIGVTGEISSCTRAASGHLYITLSEGQSTLDAICWKYQCDQLSFMPEKGQEVVLMGHLSIYSGRSKYQLIIQSIQMHGQGAMMQILHERHQKLEKKGLFSQEKKKSLPHFPRCIGVITSLSGAVIGDILHRIKQRFPLHVLVFPAAVQGLKAPDEIAQGIKVFNEYFPQSGYDAPDLIIVARGGGCIEDLWCFNEEKIVYAVAQSNIPIISAIGHETDTTLIDLAADLRAPTPSAAAEMAVRDRKDLMTQIQAQKRRFIMAWEQYLSEKNQYLMDWNQRLPHDIKEYIEKKYQELKTYQGPMKLWQKLIVSEEKRKKIHHYQHHLKHLLHKILEQKKNHIEYQNKILDALNPQNILKKGFSIVTTQDHQVVIRPDDLKPGTPLKIIFHRHQIDVITTRHLKLKTPPSKVKKQGKLL